LTQNKSLFHLCSKVCSKKFLDIFMQSFLWSHIFQDFYDSYHISKKLKIKFLKEFITPTIKIWTFIFVHFYKFTDSFFTEIERITFLLKNTPKTQYFIYFSNTFSFQNIIFLYYKCFLVGSLVLSRQSLYFQ